LCKGDVASAPIKGRGGFEVPAVWPGDLLRGARPVAKVAETRRWLRGDWAPLRYLREVQGELKKVRWPDRQELYRLTGVVLSVTIGMSILLGLVDYFFFWLFGGIFTTPQDPLRLGIAVVGSLIGLGALAFALSRE